MNIYGRGSTHGERAPVLQATLPAVGLGQVLAVAPGCGVGDTLFSTFGRRGSPLTCLGRGCGVMELVTSLSQCCVTRGCLQGWRVPAWVVAPVQGPHSRCDGAGTGTNTAGGWHCMRLAHEGIGALGQSLGCQGWQGTAVPCLPAFHHSR